MSDVRSIYDLQPGDSVTFRFVSYGASSMVLFYVRGFYNDSLGTEDQGGLPPFSIYTNGVTGTVIGPATTTGVPETPRSRELLPIPKLQPPAPDPTSASATLAFYPPRSARVQLGVYDVSGRLVATLANRSYQPGYHSVVWKGFSSSGRKMPPGVCFFRIAIDGRPAGAQKTITIAPE